MSATVPSKLIKFCEVALIYAANQNPHNVQSVAMLFMCADNFVIQLYPIEEEIDHHNISDVQLYSLRSDLSLPAATDQKAIDGQLAPLR